MPRYPFVDVISDVAILREIMGTPSDLVVRKQLDHLDEHARRFIERSPFLVVGTAEPGHEGDVSPRGDAPGFVAVLDDNTLVIPDRPGNRRIDSLLNILHAGSVALIFMVPGSRRSYGLTRGHASYATTHCWNSHRPRASGRFLTSGSRRRSASSNVARRSSDPSCGNPIPSSAATALLRWRKFWSIR